MNSDESPPDPGVEEGLPVVACWGDRCLKARLLSESAPDPLGRHVDLLIPSEELLRDPPDLLVPVKVWLAPELGVPEEHHLRFGGYVISLEPRDEKTWLLKAHNVAKWSEGTSGGLGIRPFDPREVFWSIARDQGTPPDKVHIAGWEPPSERFLVAVPVEGIEPTGELDAGSLGMTKDPEVPKRWIGLGPGDLQAAFVEPQFWAVTWVEAPTLWDAEQAAVRRFERLVRRVVLAARYSLPAVPGGTLRAFRRARHLEQVRLRPIAGVEGMRTQRTWLRGYGRSQVEVKLDSGVLEGVQGFIGTPNEQIDEAISAWHRATKERDASVAVVALAEALEFYAAETKVAKLFTPAELKTVREAAIDAFAEILRKRGTTDPRGKEKSKRIEDVVGGLNAPPFNVRLKAALAADGVPLTPSEFDVLAHFRLLRDKIVHGQDRELPDEDELDQAVGLVNRILLHRLHRLRA